MRLQGQVVVVVEQLGQLGRLAQLDLQELLDLLERQVPQELELQVLREQQEQLVGATGICSLLSGRST
jgi:hypothetical protein